MIKYLCGAVHLPEDHYHFIVNEFFELPQVTHHLHLQLRADLHGWEGHREVMRSFCSGLSSQHEAQSSLACTTAFPSAAHSRLTSFEVMFSKSFCIMISLSLVLISRSVRSRSVGLSEKRNRVTGRENKLDS